MHAHPHPRPQAKNQKFHRLLLLLFPLFFASCEDSEIFILLNPDGSGRITTTERRLTSEIPGLQDRAVLQEVSIRTLAEIVIGTSGIDEWESVPYTITHTGDIKLELTGFFSNINDLQLETTGATSTLINGLKFDQGDATRPASVNPKRPATTRASARALRLVQMVTKHQSARR